jgi:hypothetical protein
MSYSNPTSITYRFPAETLSTAAIMGYIQGPAGLAGRVVDIAYIVTTGITVAANTVDLGVTGDVDQFATLTQDIAAANLGGNGAVITDDEIPADTVLELSTNGECTAGAADMLVTIDWF